MFSNTDKKLQDEACDSGLGDSFPEDVREGVQNLTIHERSEVGENVVHTEAQSKAFERPLDQAQEGYIFEKDEDGDNILHLAIANGNERLSQQIIDCASVESINAQNRLGQTPLMLAVLLKTTPIIRKLIDVGADLELCDSLGNNIIHLAAEYGNDSSLIEMFTASKFTNLQYLSKTYEVLLESRNYQGFTPFHVAIKCQNFKTAHLLRQIGANINAMDDTAGYTALHHLVQSGNVAHIQQFIDEFHPVIDMQSYSGLTPLHLTMDKHLEDIATVLIINGANTEIESMDGVSWSSVVHI